MLQTPPAKVVRMVRWSAFAFLALLGFPWETMTGWGVLGALAWAALAAMLLAGALSQGLALTMTVMAGFVLAYSQGIGDALAEGLNIAGLGVTRDSIMIAILHMLVFLTALLATSLLMRRGLHRLGQKPASSDAMRAALDVGFLVFLVVSAIAAFSTGFWSYWGDVARAPEGGAIRLELAYPTALIGIIGHGAIANDGRGLFGQRPWVRYAIGAGVALLLFILQSRRLMIGAGMLVAISWLLTSRAVAITRLHLVTRFFALAAVVGVFSLASVGWRELDREEEVSVTERLERAFGSLGRDEGLASFESRLTYLWFDAASYDMHANYSADLDVADLLESEVTRAIPRLILTSKDDVSGVSCETALEGFGLPDDLPCTPISEGVLIGGLFGVLFAGMLWGALLGLGELAIARGPGLASTFALIGLMPLMVLESGLFAWVAVVRNGLIGLVVVGAVYGAVRLLMLGRRA